jgi:hypothetical protein
MSLVEVASDICGYRTRDQKRSCIKAEPEEAFELTTDLSTQRLSNLAAEVLWPTFTAIPASRNAAMPSTVNSRIWICNAEHDSFHLGRNQSIAAGRSALAGSSMATRFQINVDSCASRTMAGFFERQDLGMFDSLVPVKALANNGAILDYHGATSGLGFTCPSPLAASVSVRVKKIQILLRLLFSFGKVVVDHPEVRCPREGLAPLVHALRDVSKDFRAAEVTEFIGCID